MTIRRGGYDRQPVSYGSVGASLASDLMRFPPKGFWPSEGSSRLGSGEERFEAAREALWQWRVQLSAGHELVDVSVGAPDAYRGLGGSRLGDEVSYTPEGWPTVSPGQTVAHRIPIAYLREHVWRVEAHSRVVWVIDERDRAGFGLGTLDDHLLSGEEAFVVEHRDDGSVWFVYRQMSHPVDPTWRALTPFLRWQQRQLAARYLRALHPAITDDQDPATASAAIAAPGVRRAIEPFLSTWGRLVGTVHAAATRFAARRLGRAVITATNPEADPADSPRDIPVDPAG